MRILLLLALAVVGRAETIRYYLHDATIGDDPRHAVNAPVTGIFDFDIAREIITRGRLDFTDAGYGNLLSANPLPGEFAFAETSNASADSVTHMFSYTNYEWYGLPSASIYFTQALGGSGVSIDLARSFVQFEECLVPSNGGCVQMMDGPTVLRLNSGYVSTSQTTPRTLAAQFGLRELDQPVANPEPSTFVLSATCGCLFAWRMRRTRRRRSA